MTPHPTQPPLQVYTNSVAAFHVGAGHARCNFAWVHRCRAHVLEVARPSRPLRTRAAFLLSRPPLARAPSWLFIGVDEASSAKYQAGTKDEKGEGSKLALIIRCAQKFFSPCVYVGGTPTVVAACITLEKYEKGDQSLFIMRSSCCPDLRQEF